MINPVRDTAIKSRSWQATGEYEETAYSTRYPQPPEKMVNVSSTSRYFYCSGDLEAAMGSSVGGGRRVSMMSDEELLRTIGEDLRSLYTEIIRQPLPPKIEAALTRIDHAQRGGSNLTRPASHWARTSPGF
jgi:hypothetical protein